MARKTDGNKEAPGIGRRSIGTGLDIVIKLGFQDGEPRLAALSPKPAVAKQWTRALAQGGGRLVREGVCHRLDQSTSTKLRLI